MADPLRYALREALARKLHDVTGLTAGDALLFEDCLTLADEVLNGTQVDVEKWCDGHESAPIDCPADDLDACDIEEWTVVRIPPEEFDSSEGRRG